MNEPTLAFACPVCGSPMLIPDSLRGRELQCPHENCGAIFQTPALDEPVQHEGDSTEESAEPGAASDGAAPDGAKNRRKQLPKGPGLKRKGAPAGPRPTRTAPAKPPPAGGASSPPEPPKPPAPAPKAAMGTGTKLSYLLGILIVVGAVIYHKTSKPTPPAGAPTPAATVQAPAAPAARNNTTDTLKAIAPVPSALPAGKKKGKEMTDEERNRFNESMTKADEEKRAEERRTFEKRLERAAEGSKTAQYDVGMMYLNGLGVEPDRAKAREWLDKAAAQNYPAAFSGLGEIEALEGHRDEAIAYFVQAGGLCVDGFVNDEPKAKSVVYKALEQLAVLGAMTEHQELAAKTTRKDEPQADPAREAPAPETSKPPTTPAPVEPAPAAPAPVLDLPPLPDPPPPIELPPEPEPPPPAPDTPPGEIKEP